MLAIIRTWWPALIPIAIGLAFWGHGLFVARETRLEVAKDHKIERLQEANDSQQDTLTIKRKQDENRALPRTVERARQRLLDGTF